MTTNTLLSLVFVSLLCLCGCASTAPKSPLKIVDHVDLPRFMGGWYVIGTIPWIVEKNNVGTMDIYSMRSDGRIDITYAFYKKALSNRLEKMHAVGTVLDTKSNARWGVQFLWPFQAPYLVIDLAPDYSTTIIGYPSRDLIWIMARTPTLPAATYNSLLRKACDHGYDIRRIMRVPQRPESAQDK